MSRLVKSLYRQSKLSNRLFSSLSVQELPHCVQISNIDLTQQIDSNNQKYLIQLLSKHHILHFNQQLTAATQLADLAKIFSPRLQLYGDKQNEIQMYIVHDRDKEYQGSDFWHSDLSYHPIPAYTTLLYGMEIPIDKNQGNTQFINMEERYNYLSNDLQEYYQTLKGVHNISHNNGYTLKKYKDNKESPKRDDTIHSLIRIHPITKNKIIFANPAYTHTLIDSKTGIKLKNSDQILENIFDHCISQNDLIFDYQWNAGDLIVWDNISLLHRATTIDMDPKYKRVMLRCCTICNEPPIPANEFETN